MGFPRVSLAIDNRFAAKRWPSPSEWVYVAGSLGLRYVEANTDTELDPLHMGSEYLRRWSDEVRNASESGGCRVCALRSGEGVGSTLGLLHPDEGVRRRFCDHWVKPLVDLAADLHAVTTFRCHGLPDRALQQPEEHHKQQHSLISILEELSEYAGARSRNGAEGLSGSLALEPGYSPHEPPWTIEQTLQMLSKVAASGSVIHTGHPRSRSGFLKPDRQEILEALRKERRGRSAADIWLGPVDAQATFREAVLQPSLDEEKVAYDIEQQMESRSYLFADPRDTQLREWIAALGHRTPIIHVSAEHMPGNEMLHALYESFRGAEQAEGGVGTPKHVYISLETAPSLERDSQSLLQSLASPIAQLREMVPEDETPLDQLVEQH
jgi:hypothetical protein